MIPFLFFAICAPMLLDGQVYEYDCDWKLVQIESEESLLVIYHHYKAPKQEDKDHIAGLTIHNFKTIYIIKGEESRWTMLGCTVLWHELLHAMGYDHEEMSVCEWKPKQKPNTWTVLIP